MTDPTQFADIGDFDIQRQQLARRRKLAEELLRTRNPENGVSFAPNGGVIFSPSATPGGALANGVDAIRGMFESQSLDREERDLAAREAKAANDVLSSIPQQGDPNRQQALLNAGNRMPSLRNSISALLAADERAREAELNRIDRGEQAAADRVAREESDAKYRRTFEQQKELKQVPTIHITNSSGAGGAANPFAGTSTQVGVDRNGNPVYRVSKTGSVYSFDENGQPVAHEGVIMPKPAAAKEPTESERSSAGYLGRMEAAEKNLANAEPLPLLQQKGLDKAPSLTNYTLTPKQQVQRQQQEDWVRAKLRKESGAVIGDEEMAREIRTYFPQAGDSPQVIQQKAQSRAQAHEQMRSSAGNVKPTVAAPVGAPAEQSDKLTPAEQAELDRLRTKHRRQQ